PKPLGADTANDDQELANEVSETTNSPARHRPGELPPLSARRPRRSRTPPADDEEPSHHANAAADLTCRAAALGRPCPWRRCPRFFQERVLRTPPRDLGLQRADAGSAHRRFFL